jgi:hypothetical protein
MVWHSNGKEENRMKGSIFSGNAVLNLALFPDLSVLKEETMRYSHFPKMMSLFEGFNGFFDSKFESYWEEKTGSPWQEWGKL